VLSTSDKCTIEFDDRGICNYCREFEINWARLPHSEEARRELLASTVEKIRQTGKDRAYDCILGVSGGVDSTYMAYVAHQLELRPLVVHFDNGWNSETAVQNVENLVNRLGFDLETFVIDWEEFREMQLAYLRASVIDIEVLTDHAIFGTLFQMAIDRRIPFVLSGSNLATEGILPGDWVFNKRDHRNIAAIYKAFGNGRLRSYPLLTRRKKRRIARAGIEVIEILDIVAYDKAEAKSVIQRELGWRDYGGKHYESVWTRFYQGYILPKKFGIDKRKAHLSTLINSGQITRDEALAELKEPIYPPELFVKDYAFVCKKLGLTEETFRAIMEQPPRSHHDFPTEGSLFHEIPQLAPLRPSWEWLKRRTGIDRNRLRRIVGSFAG